MYAASPLMESIKPFLDLFLNLDKTLNDWAGWLGPWLYFLLFVIVFCETGLVVTPFLPGDSLLFAVGALAATQGSPIDVYKVGILLIIAAIIGDAVNYAVGWWLGPKVFSREDSWLLNKKHLIRTHEFYEKHGGKTIIIARFMPIVRTFAPFVAGVGKMTYSKFATYNVVGALFWVISFLALGFIFGNQPIVKRHFHLVIIGIVIVSCLPPFFEWLRMRNEKKD
jgi:membrane-associated protein